MKHIVEYKLHGGSIPYFIEDGGYFSHNGKLIGQTKDDVNCYIPPNTTLITFANKNDFIVYVVALSLFAPIETELTEQEKMNLASNWWDARH